MTNITPEMQEQLEQAQENIDVVYRQLKENPTLDLLADHIIFLLEYSTGSTQAYLTNQATSLALIEALQEKGLIDEERFKTILEEKVELVRQNFINSIDPLETDKVSEE